MYVANRKINRKSAQGQMNMNPSLSPWNVFDFVSPVFVLQISSSLHKNIEEDFVSLVMVMVLNAHAFDK